MRDILVRLREDAGQLTLATLFQEREAAACEIERLRRQLESKVSVAPAPQPSQSKTLHPPPVQASVEMSALQPNALLRLSDVSTLLGISRSTIYNWMSNRRFPAPMKIGERAVR
jgi:predicted DNA-binding transcriptional regulator AlpA